MPLVVISHTTHRELIGHCTLPSSLVDGFRGSYLLNPGALPAGTGYTIQVSRDPRARSLAFTDRNDHSPSPARQLTDTLNSTNIYAESESFELKPAGSTYPTVTPAGASSPATVSQSMGTATSTGAGSQSSAPTTSTPANGAEALNFGWTKVGAVVGLGAVGALLV